MRALIAAVLFLCAVLSRTVPAAAAGERFPGMTPERWRADLETFAKLAPARHGNLYRFMTPEQFAGAVRALEEKLPQLDDDAIVAGLERIVASIGDGHDGVIEPCGSGDATNFPLRLARLSDGVLVTGAPHALAPVVGARLVAVEGKPIDAVWDALAPVIPHDHDNDSVSSHATSFLTCTGLLHGLGLIPRTAEAAFTFERNGRRTTLRLRPQVSWASTHGLPPRDWDVFAGARAPLARSSRDLAWYRWIENDGVLYVQLNAIANPPGTTLAAFADEVFRAADTHPVRSFVLDLRNNGGGDNTLEKPLIVGIVRRAALSERGHLFIITSPATFSAAQNLINRLQNYAEPTFVGEPSGENVNFYGDTVRLELPNSGLKVALAHLYWQDMDPRDRRTATFPELAAPATLRDYVEGRDRAYEAVLAHRDDPPLEQTLRTAARSGYDPALAAYDAFAGDPVHRYVEAENRVNRLGYVLLHEGDRSAAIALFRVNAERHPQSWNAWDSLGEGYAATGDKPHAIEAYERSLQLNADNAGGRDALKRLRGG
ncbi:MAG: hypothetical protein JO083_09895 [Candidatus Eremiobacteraeota bacterium]|nr:hypothetical protein [Candidatus Eremiobacteraeota bacterium]